MGKLGKDLIEGMGNALAFAQGRQVEGTRKTKLEIPKARPGSFSDYIVYVDESGDHSLVSIDPLYPIFVLVFCIFRKSAYATQVTPALQSLKFKFFGHDMVVLHEHSIRKQTGAFRILRQQSVREAFNKDIGELIDSLEFTVIATCIHKERLRVRYSHPDNPYDLALKFGLEQVHKLVGSKGETFVVAESRGKKEDRDLELEFRRICDGSHYKDEQLPFQFILVGKKVNSAGLQIADLMARPIGRHVLKPDQPNRAYEIIEKKLDRRLGNVLGCGLKIFP